MLRVMGWRGLYLLCAGVTVLAALGAEVLERTGQVFGRTRRLEVSGFEVVGPNAQISYEEAFADRLLHSNRYSGRGIVARSGSHIRGGERHSVAGRAARPHHRAAPRAARACRLARRWRGPAARR